MKRFVKPLLPTTTLVTAMTPLAGAQAATSEGGPD